MLIEVGQTGTIAFYDKEFLSMSRDEKIRIFLFNKDVIDSISWDTIVENYMIEKRFDLSFQDMRSMGWVINYIKE